jgi:hypothetical protein
LPQKAVSFSGIALGMHSFSKSYTAYVSEGEPVIIDLGQRIPNDWSMAEKIYLRRFIGKFIKFKLK